LFLGDEVERGSMRHGPPPLTSRPGRRGGLALPTALAAVLCGSSVLVIAATGTVALAGSDRVAVEILSPTGPVGGRTTRPTLAEARPTLAEARTAVEFVVDGPSILPASGAPSRRPEPAPTTTATVTVTATVSAIGFRDS
jgi:hypothetical protein